VHNHARAGDDHLGGPRRPRATGAGELELTWNWGGEDAARMAPARNFGHLAFAVDDIHATCDAFAAAGVAAVRPPRDGKMAFVKSPDGISVELLQKGAPLAPVEPWLSMKSTGEW
jgi:lactoylglutathione lyase